MGIENTKDGKLLYHLTRLSNIESIIEHGLLSRRKIMKKEVDFYDSADGEIISKRTRLGLDKYIPFHFHPYSSFDVAVKNSTDEEFVYICITREGAKHNKCKIIPRHPLNLESLEVMEYDKGFDEIDWDTMQEKGRDDDYARQVKMAECVTDLKIPAKHFSRIYVRSNETKVYVERKLREKGIVSSPPYVSIGVWLK